MKHRVFEFSYAPGLFWFRLFGYGLHIKNVRRNPLLFSQCTTWHPILTLGPWQVRTLK